MRALPTWWRGTVFRSRTEARWAVFFDIIGLRWEYEPEGYALGDGSWYLPDFWLPGLRCWVEVKPRDLVTADERGRVVALVVGTGLPCLLLDGAPHPRRFEECVPVGSPDRVAASWRWSHFSDRYTVERAEGRPRLFTDSFEHEAEAEELVGAAMARARGLRLVEPGADAYLPLGWAGVPVQVDGNDLAGWRHGSPGEFWVATATQDAA